LAQGIQLFRKLYLTGSVAGTSPAPVGRMNHPRLVDRREERAMQGLFLQVAP